MKQYLFEDDDELLALCIIFTQRKMERSIKWMHESVNWSEYVARLRHSGSFDVKHRMDEQAFDQLVELLRPSITVNTKRSMAGSDGNEPIYPEVICAVGLRWLAGEMERSMFL